MYKVKYYFATGRTITTKYTTAKRAKQAAIEEVESGKFVKAEYLGKTKHKAWCPRQHIA